MHDKIIFLDIDGVLQPFTQYRFDHMKEDQMQAMYDRLEKNHQIDYRKYHNTYYKGYGKYDVAAVVYDWDIESVDQLKRILDTTDAKIVLSSAWRNDDMEGMKDLFRIHQLDDYFIDVTPNFSYENLDKLAKELLIPRKTAVRAFEILYYLKQHPEIKHYVAIDDMKLGDDLPGHFVHTYPRLTPKDADACIEVLNKKQPTFLWEVAGETIAAEEREIEDKKRKEHEIEQKAQPYLKSFYKQVFNFDHLPKRQELNNCTCAFSFLNHYLSFENIKVTWCEDYADFNFEKEPRMALVRNSDTKSENPKKTLYVYHDNSKSWMPIDLQNQWLYQIFKYEHKTYVLGINNYKESLASIMVYQADHSAQFELSVHYLVDASDWPIYGYDLFFEDQLIGSDRETNHGMICLMHHSRDEMLAIKTNKSQYNYHYVTIFNSANEVLAKLKWED